MSQRYYIIPYKTNIQDIQYEISHFQSEKEPHLKPVDRTSSPAKESRAAPKGLTALQPMRPA